MTTYLCKLCLHVRLENDHCEIHNDIIKKILEISSLLFLPRVIHIKGSLDGKIIEILKNLEKPSIIIEDPIPSDLEYLEPYDTVVILKRSAHLIDLLRSEHRHRIVVPYSIHRELNSDNSILSLCPQEKELPDYTSFLENLELIDFFTYPYCNLGCHIHSYKILNEKKSKLQVPRIELQLEGFSQTNIVGLCGCGSEYYVYYEQGYFYTCPLKYLKLSYSQNTLENIYLLSIFRTSARDVCINCEYAILCLPRCACHEQICLLKRIWIDNFLKYLIKEYENE